MTDTTPAPEVVTPEQVAAMCKRLQMMPTYSSDPKGLHWTPDKAAAMLEALAADLAAQKARADALERERNQWRKAYHEAHELYGQADERKCAAEAKVARLVEVLTWTDMELAKLSGLWHDVSPRKQIRAAIAEAGQ